jgi:hypothetical protein
VNPVVEHATLALQIGVRLLFLRVGKHATVSNAHAAVCSESPDCNTRSKMGRGSLFFLVTTSA